MQLIRPTVLCPGYSLEFVNQIELADQLWSIAGNVCHVIELGRK